MELVFVSQTGQRRDGPSKGRGEGPQGRGGTAPGRGEEEEGGRRVQGRGRAAPEGEGRGGEATETGQSFVEICSLFFTIHRMNIICLFESERGGRVSAERGG